MLSGKFSALIYVDSIQQMGTTRKTLEFARIAAAASAIATQVPSRISEAIGATPFGLKNTEF